MNPGPTDGIMFSNQLSLDNCTKVNLFEKGKMDSFNNPPTTTEP